jgi:hypothetical protein
MTHLPSHFSHKRPIATPGCFPLKINHHYTKANSVVETYYKKLDQDGASPFSKTIKLSNRLQI